ncbi:MAG: tetratricopeptide repeat protein [Armatimonadota bacterium]
MKPSKLLIISIFIFSIILCLVKFVYAKTNGETADEYYKKGLNCGTVGNFEEAELNFQKTLEYYNRYNRAIMVLKIIEDVKNNKVKKETAALLFNGMAHIDGGNFDEAEAEFQRAVAFEDGYAMAHFLLGFVYIGKNMLDKAEEELKKAISLDSQNCFFHDNLGTVYLRKDLQDEAVLEFKKAIEIDEKFDTPHWSLGKVYEEKGMIPEAVAEYKKAIELDPCESIYYYALGSICKDNNMTDEFIAQCKKVISLDGNNEVAHGCLAQAYEIKGMKDEAVAEYKKAIELDSSGGHLGTYYNSLLELYIEKNDYKLAAEYYNKAVKNDILIYTNIENKIKESGVSVTPHTAYDFFREGLRCAVAGDFEKAEENFKESYKYWKDVKKLNDCLEVIEELKNNKVKKEAAVCFFKGMFYNKGDKAIEEFQKAADTEPDFALPYYYLGNIYYDKDELDKSLKEFKKFVSLKPDDINARRFLGLIYYKKNMPDEAIAEFKKCLEIDPGFLIAKFNLIAVYTDKGLYNEAKAMAQDIFNRPKPGGESYADSYLRVTREYLSLGTYSIMGRISFAQSKTPEDAGILFEQAVGGDIENASIKKYLRKLGEACYYYNKAVDCGANSDFKACRENFLKALKMEKNDKMSDSYFRITDEALNDKNYGEFITHLFRGILYNLKGMREDVYFEMIKAAEAAKGTEFAGDAAEAYSLMLRAYFGKFYNDEGIVNLNEAVLRNPDDDKAHYELASAYDMKGLIDEAIPEYKKAVAINPKDKYYHSSLARAYAGKDMPDEAIIEYKKALEIDPGDSNFHGNLAKLYHKKGMLDEAAAEYKQCISISPYSENYYYDLAMVYRDKGSFDEAISALQKALKTVDWAYLHYLMAEVYYDKGDYQSAVKYCDEAVKKGYEAKPEFLEKLKQYRK